MVEGKGGTERKRAGRRTNKRKTIYHNWLVVVIKISTQILNPNQLFSRLNLDGLDHTVKHY